MALKQFKLSELAEMDGGRLAAAFDDALKRLYDDCRDRPGLKDSRTATLIVKVKPAKVIKGELDTVTVKLSFDDKIPKRKSDSYDMTATRGGMVFNDISTDDVRQRTLDMVPQPGAQTETGSRTDTSLPGETNAG